MKRLMFLTGRPGVGKTTVLKRSVEAIRGRDHSVGGMITLEIRVRGFRVGFEITDLLTGRKGMLAHVNQREGPRVSKYRVNLHDLAEVGAAAITLATDEADLVAVDEIGPMELNSVAFKEAVKAAIESGKPILGTIHHRASDPLIDLIKSRADAKIIEVTPENRESLHESIVSAILELLQSNTATSLRVAKRSNQVVAEAWLKPTRQKGDQTWSP